MQKWRLSYKQYDEWDEDAPTLERASDWDTREAAQEAAEELWDKDNVSDIRIELVEVK